MSYLDELKNKVNTKDKKKNNENLIFILILLVILLISMNYIFNNEDKKEEVICEKVEEQTQVKTDNSLEKKLENVLAQISGVSEVTIVINYTDNGRKDFAYDTKESYSDAGDVTNVEKSVAYEEENGQKSAIVKMYSNPTVEGVIIVAKGVENTTVKQKISTAVGNLLGIASYKVQVFEK